MMSASHHKQPISREVTVDVEFKTVLMPTYAPIAPSPIGRPFCGTTESSETYFWQKCRIIVIVQGKLESSTRKGKIVLTVHDIGSNANSFVDFVNASDQMASLVVEERATFLHVNVPGQEPLANDYEGAYPSMDQIAELLPQVLNHFKVHKCDVAIGDGAGADIMCRFALNFPNRLAGMMLINCSSTTHGIMENLRELYADFHLHDGQMNDSAWDYLMAHKFAHFMGDADHHQQKQSNYIDEVRKTTNLNEHNLSRFLYTFHKRTEFDDLLSLKEQLANVNTILINGAMLPHSSKEIFHLYNKMPKEMTSLYLVGNATDMLKEAPEYILLAFARLCKHCSINIRIDSPQADTKPADTS